MRKYKNQRKTHPSKKTTTHNYIKTMIYWKGKLITINWSINSIFVFLRGGGRGWGRGVEDSQKSLQRGLRKGRERVVDEGHIHQPLIWTLSQTMSTAIHKHVQQSRDQCTWHMFGRPVPYRLFQITSTLKPRLR